MPLSLVTPPTVEPLSTSEAKDHLRIDITDDDVLIDTLIKASRQYVETYTRRALLDQTWDWKFDGFPCGNPWLVFPLGNVSSVTAVTYVDSAGAPQTWSNTLYQTDLPTGPKALKGRIGPAYAQYYPTTRTDTMNAVTIRFVAGYGSAATAVPESIKAAMKLLIGHWYHNREAVVVGVGVGSVPVPQSVDALLWPYQVH